MSDKLTTLEDIIKKVKEDNQAGKDRLTTLRELCDKIFTEESEKFDTEQKNLYDTKIVPKGPNILLCLPVPGRSQNEIGFLSLEREFFTEPKITSDPEYIIVFWIYTRGSNYHPKRIRVIKVPEFNPIKVISFYAKTISFCRGE